MKNFPVVIGRSAAPPQQVREVYFILAKGLNLIKIGVSDNSRRRLKQLAEIIPDDLELMGVVECHEGGALEKRLHAQFAEHRQRGEWFRPDGRLLTYVARYAEWPKPNARLKAMAKDPTQ